MRHPLLWAWLIVVTIGCGKKEQVSPVHPNGDEGRTKQSAEPPLAGPSH
jgi:hypothetical protein